MPNFVTFDDGHSYFAISEIDSFGHQADGTFKGGTWVRLKNGHVMYTQWDVSTVAERLGPTANLHY
jgi:hypothetical protein